MEVRRGRGCRTSFLLNGSPSALKQRAQCACTPVRQSPSLAHCVGNEAPPAAPEPLSSSPERLPRPVGDVLTDGSRGKRAADVAGSSDALQSVAMVGMEGLGCNEHWSEKSEFVTPKRY